MTEFRIYNPYLCPRCKSFALDSDLVSISDKGWRYMGKCRAVKQDIRECPDYGLKKAPPACDYFNERRKK